MLIGRFRKSTAVGIGTDKIKESKEGSLTWICSKWLIRYYSNIMLDRITWAANTIDGTYLDKCLSLASGQSGQNTLL